MLIEKAETVGADTVENDGKCEIKKDTNQHTDNIKTERVVHCWNFRWKCRWHDVLSKELHTESEKEGEKNFFHTKKKEIRKYWKYTDTITYVNKILRDSHFTF